MFGRNGRGRGNGFGLLGNVPSQSNQTMQSQFGVPQQTTMAQKFNAPIATAQQKADQAMPQMQTPSPSYTGGMQPTQTPSYTGGMQQMEPQQQSLGALKKPAFNPYGFGNVQNLGFGNTSPAIWDQNVATKMNQQNATQPRIPFWNLMQRFRSR